jgi:hypothetical protein
MRRLIVNTFETICIAMVIIPTALGILWALGMSTQKELAIIYTLGVFLVTSFMAGGALTLVEIAKNTKGCLEALRDMRDTASHEAYRPGAHSA